MPLTLIVEPNPGGHRFTSVRYVAELAARTGDVALLTSRGAGDRDEFAVQLGHLDLDVVERFAVPAPNGRDLAQQVGQFCRTRTTDVVVVMDGDKALKSWWWAAPRAFRGVSRRPRVRYFLTHYPARLESATLRMRAMRLAKALLVVLAMCTRCIERAVGFSGRDERPGGVLVARAIDPALCSAHARDRAEIRQTLGLPPVRPLVGIFGGINVRKNPQLVLEAIEQVDDETALVLAGPVADDIAAWIDGLSPERRSRLFVADAFLPNEVLDQYIAAVDVVALLMTLEGPSGIQGKAMAAGVPVVSAGSRTRARELAHFRSGLTTPWSVEGVADGLRQVLADPAAFTPEPSTLPTPDQFARAILGADPGPRPRRALRRSSRRGVGEQLARVRNRALREVLPRYLRPDARGEQFVRLGTEYGGWWVPRAAVRPGAVAYCAGAGEDISFDLALHAAGCRVTTFDPTPRAIAHVEAHAPKDDRFRFLPVGWWDSEAELRFFSPRNESFVSHSAVNLQRTDTWFTAAVKPVRQLMDELGDAHVDVMKLDIEGAEYRTLDQLLRTGPLPTVLCLEFDQPAPVRRTVEMVRRLQRSGYTLNVIDGWNYTFTLPPGDRATAAD